MVCIDKPTIIAKIRIFDTCVSKSGHLHKGTGRINTHNITIKPCAHVGRTSGMFPK